MARCAAEIEAGTRAERSDGYVGYAIDEDPQKANVQWIQEREGRIYLRFYSDPVQSHGIMLAPVEVASSSVDEAGGGKYDVKPLADDRSGWWYCFASD